MSDTYTLIKYRPNGVDTCRGCVRETSDSEFELFRCGSLVEAAIIAAKAAMQDSESSWATCQWEITLLVNGLTALSREGCYDEECEGIAERFRSLRDTHLEELRKEKADRELDEKRRAEERAAEKARQAAIANEAAERARLAELKAKYEGAPKP